MLNQCFVRERSSYRVFFFSVTFSQVIETLYRSWRSFVLADNFFEAIYRGGIFFLLMIKKRNVEFVLGKILNAFCQLLRGFRRMGGLWMVGDNGFEIALGDFGIFLVAVHRRELVQVGLSKPQDDKRNILVGRMKALKFFECGDRLRILLV